jgi:hypothetical protein
MPSPRVHARAEIHLRLARPQHDKLMLLARQQRLTLNDLISGMLQKTLQPPPDDTETVWRRLERMERAVQGLTTHVQALEQHLKTTAESMRREWGQAQAEVQRLRQAHPTLTQVVEEALTVQRTRLEGFVQDLLEQAAQERSGVYAKVRSFVTRALTEPTHGRRGK